MLSLLLLALLLLLLLLVKVRHLLLPLPLHAVGNVVGIIAPVAPLVRCLPFALFLLLWW